MLEYLTNTLHMLNRNSNSTMLHNEKEKWQFKIEIVIKFRAKEISSLPNVCNV